MTLSILRSAGGCCLVLLLVVTLLPSPAAAQLKAFPQAEGFGAAASGGRGGDVYHVTNLNNSGSGSLRYGIENASSQGRTIVFDVGGWISLNSKLGIDSNKKKITIAGQTAPGGIGIRGNQFSVGGDDIVIRHMRFRPGKAAGRVDSAGANTDANRVIYDHISAGFSYDENFSVGADNLTLQYSAVTYGLIDHSAGSLIQEAGNLSFHHNLYAHNETRNPKARAELIDWRDNVVYNYHNGFIAGDSQNTVTPHWKANFDGNTYISSGRPMMTGGRDYNYDLYYDLNALDRDGDSNDDPITYNRSQAMADQSVVSSAYNWVTTPFDAPEIWQSGSPAAAYQHVLSEFGATPWDRDEVDQLVHDDVLNRSGSRVSHENQLPVSNDGYPTLGGLPAPVDSDNDGIPNAWEIKHGTNPQVPNNNGDFDYDGYTDLEEYLNDLAAFAAIDALEFQGIGRYADWRRWTNDWEPSRLDEVRINDGAAFVDAAGQKAGALHVGYDAGSDGRLYVTSGWLEVTDSLMVGGGGVGRVEQHGGEVRVLQGGVAIANGKYQLRGGALSTPLLTRQRNGLFEFTGGTLAADAVGFDLTVQGGVLAAGLDAIATTTIVGSLSIETGALAVELASSSQADRFDVSGDVLLGGNLEVSLLDGYSPATGASWLIASGESFSGAFESVTPGFTVEITDNSLWLIAGSEAAIAVAPEPISIALILTPLVGLAVMRHRNGAALLLAVLCASTTAAPDAQGGLTTAGELIADLRATDLNESSTTWINRDTTGATVGNFSTAGGDQLNVASVGGISRSLHINATNDNALLSAAATPSSVAGNNTRSVEAWVFADSLLSSQGVVSWGATATSEFSRFTYAGGGNGMLSAWFNDVGWEGADLPIGEWTHVAWTYNPSGAVVRGYINGELAATSTMPSRLSTATTVVTLGASRTNASADPFDGYIADMRVHTGLLADADVLNNYLEGLSIEPDGVLGDYNNNGVVDAADYTVWRDNLGDSELANEEVSPHTIDIADYLYWRERYGATDLGAPAMVAEALTVPEPHSVVLLAMAVVLGRRRPRRTTSCG